METLNDFLGWLTGADGGALLVVAFVISWMVEGRDWWQNFSKSTKELIVLLAACLLGLAAVVLQRNPLLVEAIDPFFRPLASIAALWLTTQAAHRLNPLRQ